LGKIEAADEWVAGVLVVVHHQNQLVVVIAVQDLDVDAGFCHSPRELSELTGNRLREALNDDLNAPRAVAAAFEFVSDSNRLLDQGTRPGDRALAAWRLVDSVLDATTPVRYTTTGSGLDLSTLAALPDVPPSGADDGLAWARRWAEVRVIAKARRDFGEADRIRKLLTDNGFEVRDTRNGSEVIRKWARD